MLVGQTRRGWVGMCVSQTAGVGMQVCWSVKTAGIGREVCWSVKTVEAGMLVGQTAGVAI